MPTGSACLPESVTRKSRRPRRIPRAINPGTSQGPHKGEGMRHLTYGHNLALTALVVLGLSLPAAEAVAQNGCMNVRGTAIATITGPDSATDVIFGDLAGTGTAAFTIVKIGDDGTIFFTAVHEWFITGKGSFSMAGEGVLSPTTAPGVYQLSLKSYLLPRGTGDFAGATGFLFIQGPADFITGEAPGDYHGRICVDQ
jgi:hypothetical protein